MLRCFAALINHLSVDDLDALLHTFMIPLYRILEDANVKDPQMGKSFFFVFSFLFFFSAFNQHG